MKIGLHAADRAMRRPWARSPRKLAGNSGLTRERLRLAVPSPAVRSRTVPLWITAVQGMALCAEDARSFSENGYVIVESFFSAEEIDVLSAVCRATAPRTPRPVRPPEIYIGFCGGISELPADRGGCCCTRVVLLGHSQRPRPARRRQRRVLRRAHGERAGDPAAGADNYNTTSRSVA